MAKLGRPGHQMNLENIDLLMPVALSTEERAAVGAFISGGLTDPRVAAELPPFDRPTLVAVSVPAPGFAVGLLVGSLGIMALARRSPSLAPSAGSSESLG